MHRLAVLIVAADSVVHVFVQKKDEDFSKVIDVAES
jgi:hypothetical protein